MYLIFSWLPRFLGSALLLSGGRDPADGPLYSGPSFAVGGALPITKPRVDAVMVREYVQGVLMAEIPRDSKTAIPVSEASQEGV